MLGFVCFAQNSLTNPTLGARPHKRIFGRRLTGPLDMLKSMWTEGSLQETVLKKSVSQYLTELRDKLKLINESVQENAKVQQSQQKGRYDRHSNKQICCLTALCCCYSLHPVAKFLLHGLVRIEFSNVFRKLNT
jgi:hypothetical protein